MGCCACRPDTEITEDPDVVMYTGVGGTARFTTYGHTYLSGACNGLMFLRGRELGYVPTCGSRLWCRFMQQSWDLSSIKQLTIVRNETIPVPGNKFMHYINLKPGLKITLHSRINEVVITDMPDVVSFASQLVHHMTGEPLADPEHLQQTIQNNLYTTIYQSRAQLS